MFTFTIRGILREHRTRLPVAGLYIKAYDKDLFFDDLLGGTFTGLDGRFSIVCESGDFREFLERRPDIYFKIYRPDRQTQIHDTKDAVRWDADTSVELEVWLPDEALYDPGKEADFTLLDEDGQPRDVYEPGESLIIAARGLLPIKTYQFALSLEDEPLFTSQLISDRAGVIQSTVLWPQLGLDDPRKSGTFSVPEAQDFWRGKALSLALLDGENELARQSFRMAEVFTRPIVVSIDSDARVLNGFEIGQHPLTLGVYNLPFKGDARVYMVQRQHDWREADPFRIATLESGRPAVWDVDIGDAGASHLKLAGAEELRPGIYDFIVRPEHYGQVEKVERVLPYDVIGARRITGLVVREVFMQGKIVLGGCVNKLPISARRLVGGWPYVQYANTFELGEDVWGALDPGLVDPGNLGKMCAYYVIQSKTETQWNMSTGLNHLATLGGNPGTTKRKLQAYCINTGLAALWPAASIEGEYDIVADFGNNVPDAASFTADHSYDTPLDVIDGYFDVGFRVVADPTTLSEFPNIGNYNYTDADKGTKTVQDELAQYSTPGGFTPVDRLVPMRAHVYFPADALGATTPADISTARPNYPLIVIVHGNGQNYTSYDFLLQHFAHNGFIAASVDCRYNSISHGMNGLGRANVLFEHLSILNGDFGATVQNNIGIMGHSRGGEGVIKAARLNQQNALGHNINAVISLAPTDQYGKEVFGGAWAAPYFILYGSLDGDIDGSHWVTGYDLPQTGFALYDRASGATKSMAFVYGATHNGFITTNSDAEFADLPNALDPVHQKTISQGYMNAFFRLHLKAESKWAGIFKGEWQPQAVTQALGGAIEIYPQYKEATGVKVFDNFEGPHTATSWQQTSLTGGTLDQTGLPADPTENAFYLMDPKSPHDTSGLQLQWNSIGDEIIFTLPVGDRNLSTFETLSFRITQKAGSILNPANQSQNLRVALKDSTPNERAVRLSGFAEIPYPHTRNNANLIKSAMRTMRIPLKSYTIVCAGIPQVNLSDVVTLSFRFSEKAQGEIAIDDIEFTQ